MGNPDYVRLRVHASAKRDRIVRVSAGLYEAWVRAPAREGRANEAVLRLLAAELGHARLRLVKGATSPSKIVQVYP